MLRDIECKELACVSVGASRASLPTAGQAGGKGRLGTPGGT